MKTGELPWATARFLLGAVVWVALAVVFLSVWARAAESASLLVLFGSGAVTLAIGLALTSLVNKAIDTHVRPSDEVALKLAQQERDALEERWGRLVRQATERGLCEKAAKVAAALGTDGQYASDSGVRITWNPGAETVRVETPTGLKLLATHYCYSYTIRGDYQAEPDGGGGFHIRKETDRYESHEGWNIQTYVPGDWEKAITASSPQAERVDELRRTTESINELKKKLAGE